MLSHITRTSYQVYYKPRINRTAHNSPLFFEPGAASSHHTLQLATDLLDLTASHRITPEFNTNYSATQQRSTDH